MNTPPRPATWVPATIGDSWPETASARSLIIDVPGWTDHVAGQHIDVRLTAADGYQATRSYSLSSGPGEPPQITVERVDDGEVSPYLVDIARSGDQIEVRGPLGGYFVWQPSDRPLVLIAGGSGIAPLRAMWRAGGGAIRLLYSARTADRIIFARELASHDELDTTIHLTRDRAPGYVSRRIGQSDVASALSGLDDPAVFICGPTDFVESVATFAAETANERSIRTERFG